MYNKYAAALLFLSVSRLHFATERTVYQPDCGPLGIKRHSDVCTA